MKCKRCGVTFGWLPPFLLPHKHYTVHDVQQGIEKYVKGSDGYDKTLLKLPDELVFSVETLRNWVCCFAKQAKKLYQTARAILAELKPRSRFDKDKRLLNYSFPSAHPLAKRNGLIHLYQLFILREYFVFTVKPEEFLVWLIFMGRLQKQKNAKTTQLGLGNNKQIGNNSS